MDKQAFGIKELTVIVGIGRTALFAEIKAGRLIARKVGRRTVVLGTDLQRWLAHLPQSNAAGEADTPEPAQLGSDG